MPFSGMTGFARAEGALGDWSWAVEARSVNGRNMDVRFRGPPGFDTLERLAREGAQKRFQRGQVTIGVQARRAESESSVRIDLEQAERYLEALQPLIDSGKVQTPGADGLLALRGVVLSGDELADPEAQAAVEKAIAASLSEALDGLLEARRAEGAALRPILGDILERIEGFAETAEGEAADQPAEVKARFEKRIAELTAGHGIEPERLVQEAAVLAAKADVREELDRLKTHVESARSLIGGDGPAGRRLDFLAQEFMREANTLCSKSATKALTATGLELKAAIEQLREQVQNVE